MGLSRTTRAAMEAVLGEPVAAGCGAAPLGTVWSCGCFALPVQRGGVDWLPCPEHRETAAAHDAGRLSGIWESRLKI